MNTRGFPEDDRTIEEILNGERGGEYWSPSDYSEMEEHYDEVDPAVFEYLESLEQ